MVSAKKKILVLTEWYLPGRKSGGPVKSIESFVWFMREYFDIFILTTDTDLGATAPYDTIQTDTWISKSDKSKVMYLSKSQISMKTISEKLSETYFDFIYFSGIYNIWFSIIPLRIIRKLKINATIVVAPRGMLSEGSINIKYFKKKLFLTAARFFGLYNQTRWHASSEIEANEVRGVFGDKCNIYVAGNFSKPVLVKKEGITKEKYDLRLFFLSRISPVKNLHVALEALVALDEFKGNIVFDIYGRHEDSSYVQFCSNLIKKMKSNIQVQFKGEIENHILGDILPGYHFLFLPTANENFGHSILESLQCACPVIISNRTPWRNLQKIGCGWDIEPSAENFYPILTNALEMDNSTFQEMKACAIRFAMGKLNNAELLEATLKVFS